MFNIVNIILTSIISWGMALNVMPFDNGIKEKQEIHEITPKKENDSSNPYVTEYELAINKTNEQSASFPQSGSYAGTTEYAIKRDIRNNNNYLNIIGNEWYSNFYSPSENINYLQNYETLNGNYNNVDPCIMTISQLIKVTPYNFNKETNINLNIDFELPNFVQTLDMVYEILDLYMYRCIYTTYENMDQFINAQLNTRMSYNINQYITNINNGFYYEKNEKLFTPTYDQDNETIYLSDEIELTIVPNKDTYIFLQYTPMVNAHEFDITTGLWDDVISPRVPTGQQGSQIHLTNEKITGINIIPNGTYEVIDIPGLMWDILQMPFAFVSQAFNLTLFPGTQYQLNIANLFLSIIAVIVFVWLITFFIKMKG